MLVETPPKSLLEHLFPGWPQAIHLNIYNRISVLLKNVTLTDNGKLHDKIARIPGKTVLRELRNTIGQEFLTFGLMFSCMVLATEYFTSLSISLILGPIEALTKLSEISGRKRL
ncbi:uncharacterized protein Bfra_002894 [Botrytis fragariae]|uniref:Uncharacterized protein n=1 Tax=Botrytis fragariae TaxID=1964551 RepID=A0A8H6AZC0_9HELO|nr:uncharacterized protein Bfra_002894 [Botrytis fragariae]KAF5876489.1 hypothetical protein Bfra_002894 [Botrytis fragariae]